MVARPNHAEGVSVCAKRNFIDAKHHIIAKHIICTKCNIIYGVAVTSFICAASGNDVVPFGTNEKILKANAFRIFCIKATKKIFFAFFNKVSNSNGVNL